MIKFFKQRPIVTILSLVLWVCAAGAQEANLDNGKELFKANCASCHNKNMTADLTGPALGAGVHNWDDYPREDLYAWIRNSQAMVASGHPRALQVFNEWKPTVMNSFTALTDQEIEDMLGYIEGVYTGTYGPAPAEAGGGQIEIKKDTNPVIYFILIGSLILLSLLMARVFLDLQFKKDQLEGKNTKPKSLLEWAFNPRTMGIITFFVIIGIGFFAMKNAIAYGRQQGYQPDQPIKFSHKTHAGDNQIDCQFCHDSARRSKHSSIPAGNTCMKCHSAIKVGTTYGTQELSKIYASVGWDPNEDKYIENYDDLKTEEIRDVFMKWFDANIPEETNAEVREEIKSDQWNALAASLTNEQKEKIQGPVEWIRVHNLPDHVYFNHSQHVNVAGLECQTCHGPVEEMETLEQWAPLSMGWCVNCHRQTDITGSVTENPYYQAHYHFGDDVKVKDIGGLECQKCHY